MKAIVQQRVGYPALNLAKVSAGTVLGQHNIF